MFLYNLVYRIPTLDICMTLICIDVYMQWPMLKSPNFWVSSSEYCVGLLSLGWGHYIARLNTRALGSLQHAARLETSWPGQWLCYLAAVVSICEYTVSNKGGLPCHYHDCWRLWGLCPHSLYFVGATASTTPSVPPPMNGMLLVLVAYITEVQRRSSIVHNVVG